MGERALVGVPLRHSRQLLVPLLKTRKMQIKWAITSTSASFIITDAAFYMFCASGKLLGEISNLRSIINNNKLGSSVAFDWMNLA